MNMWDGEEQGGPGEEQGLAGPFPPCVGEICIIYDDGRLATLAWRVALSNPGTGGGGSKLQAAGELQ
jgi:hypothetical protein